MRILEIELDDETAELLEEEVRLAAGATVDELVSRGILLVAREREDAAWKERELQRRLDKADREIERGDVVETTAEELLTQILERRASTAA